MKKYIITILILIISTISYSQPCKNFHEKKCYSFGYPFKYSQQSQDFELSAGKTTEFNVMVMAGYEYNFSLGFEKKLGNVSFKIANNLKTIVYYDSNDSKDAPYDKQFIVDKTKKLKVIITVPELNYNATANTDSGCAGFLVEFAKQPKVGF